MLVEQLKVCRKCNSEKPIDDFHNDRNKPDGRTTQCKGCARAAANEWARLNRGTQPIAERECVHCKQILPAAAFAKSTSKSGLYSYCVPCASILRRVAKFGIDAAEVVRLVANASCAICDKRLTESQVHIDHDHKTGRIRGVLCTCCNTGIGQFQDSAELADKAAAYLRNYASFAEQWQADGEK